MDKGADNPTMETPWGAISPHLRRLCRNIDIAHLRQAMQEFGLEISEDRGDDHDVAGCVLRVLNRLCTELGCNKRTALAGCKAFISIIGNVARRAKSSNDNDKRHAELCRVWGDLEEDLSRCESQTPDKRTALAGCKSFIGVIGNVARQAKSSNDERCTALCRIWGDLEEDLSLYESQILASEPGSQMYRWILSRSDDGQRSFQIIVNDSAHTKLEEQFSPLDFSANCESGGASESLNDRRAADVLVIALLGDTSGMVQAMDRLQRGARNGEGIRPKTEAAMQKQRSLISSTQTGSLWVVPALTQERRRCSAKAAKANSKDLVLLPVSLNDSDRAGSEYGADGEEDQHDCDMDDARYEADCGLVRCAAEATDNIVCFFSARHTEQLIRDESRRVPPSAGANRHSKAWTFVKAHRAKENSKLQHMYRKRVNRGANADHDDDEASTQTSSIPSTSSWFHPLVMLRDSLLKFPRDGPLTSSGRLLQLKCVFNVSQHRLDNAGVKELVKIYTQAIFSDPLSYLEHTQAKDASSMPSPGIHVDVDCYAQTPFLEQCNSGRLRKSLSTSSTSARNYWIHCTTGLVPELVLPIEKHVASASSPQAHAVKRMPEAHAIADRMAPCLHNILPSCHLVRFERLLAAWHGCVRVFTCLSTDSNPQAACQHSRVQSSGERLQLSRAFLNKLGCVTFPEASISPVQEPPGDADCQVWMSHRVSDDQQALLVFLALDFCNGGSLHSVATDDESGMPNVTHLHSALAFACALSEATVVISSQTDAAEALNVPSHVVETVCDALQCAVPDEDMESAFFTGQLISVVTDDESSGSLTSSEPRRASQSPQLPRPTTAQQSEIGEYLASDYHSERDTTEEAARHLYTAHRRAPTQRRFFSAMKPNAMTTSQALHLLARPATCRRPRRSSWQTGRQFLNAFKMLLSCAQSGGEFTQLTCEGRLRHQYMGLLSDLDAFLVTREDRTAATTTQPRCSDNPERKETACTSYEFDGCKWQRQPLTAEHRNHLQSQGRQCLADVDTITTWAQYVNWIRNNRKKQVGALYAKGTAWLESWKFERDDFLTKQFTESARQRLQCLSDDEELCFGHCEHHDCHLPCLLPRGHSDEFKCDCLVADGKHVCGLRCSFGEGEHDGDVACQEPPGHHLVTDDKERKLHLCGHAEGRHRCRENGGECALRGARDGTCEIKCKYWQDHDLRGVERCQCSTAEAEHMCPESCVLQRNEGCNVYRHGGSGNCAQKYTVEHERHLCGSRHVCQQPCNVNVRGTSVLCCNASPAARHQRDDGRLPKDREVAANTPYRYMCSVQMAPDKVECGQEYHSCGVPPDEHFCAKTCRLCKNHCSLRKHGPDVLCRTEHGLVKQDVRVKPLNGDVQVIRAATKTCEEVCTVGGKSHCHVVEAAVAAQSGLMKKTDRYRCRDDGSGDISIAHSPFWEAVMQFEDPHDSETAKAFDACPEKCRVSKLPEAVVKHVNGGRPCDTACSGFLLHLPLVSDGHDSGYLSTDISSTDSAGDGKSQPEEVHHFKCEHKCQHRCPRNSSRSNPDAPGHHDSFCAGNLGHRHSIGQSDRHLCNLGDDHSCKDACSVQGAACVQRCCSLPVGSGHEENGKPRLHTCGADGPCKEKCESPGCGYPCRGESHAHLHPDYKSMYHVYHICQRGEHGRRCPKRESNIPGARRCGTVFKDKPWHDGACDFDPPKTATGGVESSGKLSAAGSSDRKRSSKSQHRKQDPVLREVAAPPPAQQSSAAKGQPPSSTSAERRTKSGSAGSGNRSQKSFTGGRGLTIVPEKLTETISGQTSPAQHVSQSILWGNSQGTLDGEAGVQLTPEAVPRRCNSLSALNGSHSSGSSVSAEHGPVKLWDPISTSTPTHVASGMRPVLSRPDSVFDDEFNPPQEDTALPMYYCDVAPDPTAVIQGADLSGVFPGNPTPSDGIEDDDFSKLARRAHSTSLTVDETQHQPNDHQVTSSTSLPPGMLSGRYSERDDDFNPRQDDTAQSRQPRDVAPRSTSITVHVPSEVVPASPTSKGTRPLSAAGRTQSLTAGGVGIATADGWQRSPQHLQHQLSVPTGATGEGREQVAHSPNQRQMSRGGRRLPSA